MEYCSKHESIKCKTVRYRFFFFFKAAPHSALMQWKSNSRPSRSSLYRCQVALPGWMKSRRMQSSRVPSRVLSGAWEISGWWLVFLESLCRISCFPLTSGNRRNAVVVCGYHFSQSCGWTLQSVAGSQIKLVLSYLNTLLHYIMLQV